ncbi:purine nucleoside permease-domain-containing protein [Apiospora hydei]|uniref:Purine nucleoside permease-domain-containing protein n=1 Tax=Apiospora hydei TaxID=1337664 RepID=A0ABR1VXS1_9PEZI
MSRSLLDTNFTIDGLSPLNPQVHCTNSGEVCQATLGESEINAAASMSALVLGADAANLFDFGRTYFLISGIAGVNPKLGTLGSVALAKFAVQAALQYELDARDMPTNWTTGYLAYGTDAPGRLPTIFYGTEVMELNEALRDAAFALARDTHGDGGNDDDDDNSTPVLDDDAAAAAYRSKYRVNDLTTTTTTGDTTTDDGGGTHHPAANNIYAAATGPPSVLRCDTVTSDVYYSGALLSEAFENTTRAWTNQSQVTYCMTAQEDSAVLAVLLRAQLARRADLGRAIVMRAGSNFDRPPPSMTALDHLLLLGQNGFQLAINNTWKAGSRIVAGILSDWDAVYGPGIPAANYLGDVFGSLGGTPNFGPGSVFGGKGAAPDGSTYAGREGGGGDGSAERGGGGGVGKRRGLLGDGGGAAGG